MTKQKCWQEARIARYLQRREVVGFSITHPMFFLSKNVILSKQEKQVTINQNWPQDKCQVGDSPGHLVGRRHRFKGNVASQTMTTIKNSDSTKHLAHETTIGDCCRGTLIPTSQLIGNLPKVLNLRLEHEYPRRTWDGYPTDSSRDKAPCLRLPKMLEITSCRSIGPLQVETWSSSPCP